MIDEKDVKPYTDEDIEYYRSMLPNVDSWIWMLVARWIATVDDRVVRTVKPYQREITKRDAKIAKLERIANRNEKIL